MALTDIMRSGHGSNFEERSSKKKPRENKWLWIKMPKTGRRRRNKQEVMNKYYVVSYMPDGARINPKTHLATTDEKLLCTGRSITGRKWYIRQAEVWVVPYGEIPCSCLRCSRIARRRLDDRE